MSDFVSSEGERRVARLERRREVAARFGFALAFGFAMIVAYALVIYDVNGDRRLCERLDVVRDVEYDVLVEASSAQLAQAEEAQGAERRALIDAGETYRELYRTLVSSTHAFRDEARGKPHVDCTEAHPYPPPANWIESAL